MIRYLFDASAAVDRYVPRSEIVGQLLKMIVAQRRSGKATVLIPSFCVAEVFNAFAKMHFDPDEHGRRLNRIQYEDVLKRFRMDVRWGRLFYPYDLSRYHILATDCIIPVEHNLARRKDFDRCSTFDILLIAMACELAYVGPAADVYLVTCDSRINIVCQEFRRLDEATLAKWKVPRPFDEPGYSRWLPPRVLYLPRMTPADLPTGVSLPG